MSAAQPGWLTARPIAHRGLHDKMHHVIENSVAAADAAIARDFAIECVSKIKGGLPYLKTALSRNQP